MVGGYDCLCTDDVSCDFYERCFCVDCSFESYCSSCYNDGSCDLLWESCDCIDCSSLPLCGG